MSEKRSNGGLRGSNLFGIFGAKIQSGNSRLTGVHMGFSRIVPLFSFGDNNQKKMFIVVHPKFVCLILP